MEVEGSKTYANCVTIKNFMIQTDEKYMALMLTSFRYFSNITFLETSPDHPYLKIVHPSPYFLILLSPLLNFSSQHYHRPTNSWIHKSVEQQTNVPLSNQKIIIIFNYRISDVISYAMEDISLTSSTLSDL